MQARDHTFLTTKAFLVNKNGIIQYVDASVATITERAIDVRIGFPEQPGYCGRLVSNDAFTYRSIADTGETRHSLTCRCFLRGTKVLLYGEWRNEVFNGELCIHVTMQNLLTKYENTSYYCNALTPAA